MTTDAEKVAVADACRAVSADFPQATRRRYLRRGFTLIELIVTMTIIALLLSLAVPRYVVHIERTKEAVLKENLYQVRDALDKFYGDNGRYPTELGELVARKYLRRIPADPITDSTTTWVLVPPADPAMGRVADIRSGANGNGRDGTPYRGW